LVFLVLVLHRLHIDLDLLLANILEEDLEHLKWNFDFEVLELTNAGVLDHLDLLLLLHRPLHYRPHLPALLQDGLRLPHVLILVAFVFPFLHP